jgi:hypothetical protein
MALTGLFASVVAVGGKIVRSVDGGLAVQGVDVTHLPPDLLAALVAHRTELNLIVPSHHDNLRRCPAGD